MSRVPSASSIQQYSMAKNDPYPFAISHVMSGIDRALEFSGSMSDSEYYILQQIRQRVLELDPSAEGIRRINYAGKGRR